MARHTLRAVQVRDIMYGLLDKWWPDEKAPVVLVKVPAALVQGEPCTSEDRVTWLMDRGAFQQALVLVNKDEKIDTQLRNRVG